MKSFNYLTNELFTRQNQNALLQFMGILPNPDKILRNSCKTIEAYRDLKNDPHVWSCIQSRKSGVLAQEHIIIPNGASDDVVKQIESCLNAIDLQQLERDILEAPLFGYQPLEIVWKLTNGRKKLFIPHRIEAKPQEWFFFDGNGEFRFRKSGSPKGEIPPEMKVLVVRFEYSYMNPYGNALLSKCYWPVTFKNGGLRFWVNFTEKYGMPFLLGQYTRGASYEETKQLAEELANMTEDAVIVAPSDINIELHEPARYSSIQLYRELIKHCNAEISKALLSQTLTTELETGSYAASQTHYKVRQEVVRSDIRLVEGVLNKIISYFVQLNYANSPIPYFQVLTNESENSQRIDRDLKITQTKGLRFTKEYWQSTYGFKDNEIEML